MKDQHFFNVSKFIYINIFILWSSITSAVTLDENCIISILNRTVQVNANGGWSLPNLPADTGRVRARATCVQDGQTLSGQSDYFLLTRDSITKVGDIVFGNLTPIPVSLAYAVPSDTSLDAINATHQSQVIATYADASTVDVTNSSLGTNYSSTNPAIASVSQDGQVTAVSSGTILLTARKDGVIAIKRIIVNASGDTDGDGLPDDFELSNGLDPNDPIDANEDQDNDGLSAIDEFALGTDINVVDTDGDGISDGEEVAVGEDGFQTDPLKADTDGDGLNDYLEILSGSSPTDASDTNFAAALESISVSPSSVSLTFNALNNEESAQLTVTGTLIDGSVLDLTSKSTGTSYLSSDLTIASFGFTDGEVFAGQPGSATITVANSGQTVVVNVSVDNFQPTPLSLLTIVEANNVDVLGNYAFVAAGSTGLKVVDTTDKTQPQIVATLETAGEAKDIRIVGETAYIADGENGLVIVDIKDPLLPKLLSVYKTIGDAQDIKIDLQYAYIAEGNAGVEIVDVSDPARPVFKSEINDLGVVKGIDVEGNTAVIVAGQALNIIDITDKLNPVKRGNINIGLVNDVAIRGNHAFVAAYSTGYRVINIEDSEFPVIVGGDRSFIPWDVALTNDGGFAFFADILFVNAVPFVNTEIPDEPVFQGVIDFSSFGDYNGRGIALDASYVYVTTFGNGLMIGQYLTATDRVGIAPIVQITSHKENDVVVEGSTIIVTSTAQDDVAVRDISILVNDQVVITDTTSPFQVPVSIPLGSTSMTLAASATDIGNNTGLSDVINLIVDLDTDKDGLGDGQEADLYGTDPNDSDTDDDGLLDGREVALGTNPLLADTDGDGIDDKTEIDQETDPLNSDVTVPVIESINPADGVIDIAENSVVTISFNEALRSKTVNTENILLQEVLTNAIVQGSFQLNDGNKQIVFTPNSLLADLTEYQLTIQNIRDEAGNIAASVSSHFTTGNLIDLVRPTVIATNLKPDFSYSTHFKLPINSAVIVEMSEPVEVGTVTPDTFYIKEGANKIAGIITVSENKRVLSFVPNINLLTGATYSLVVTQEIKDLFGNPLYSYYGDFGESLETAFTEDFVAPSIESSNIADGQLNVPINLPINIRFDEPISSVGLSKIKLKMGSVSIPVTRTLKSNIDNQIQNRNRILTLQPESNLPGNTEFTLEIDGVTDIAGNLLSTSVRHSFITGSETDTTAGSVVRGEPYRAADVPLNPEIKILLSEPVDPTTVNVQFAESLSQYDNRYVAVTHSVSGDGKVITVKPIELLKSNSRYVVYLTGLKDIAGNQITDNLTRYGGFYFNTGIAEDKIAPVVTSSSIADGFTEVPVNPTISLVFNERLSSLCVSNDTVKVLSGGLEVAGNVDLSPDQQTISFVTTELLDADSTYTLQLAGLCDFSGNTLDDYSSTFTTSTAGVVDSTKPIITMTPAPYSLDNDVNSDVRLSFNEAIDPGSVNSNTIKVSVYRYSGTVAGSLSVNGNEVVFSPLNPLPENVRINVLVNGVKDLAGNNGYLSRYFNTGAGKDITAPEVISVTPVDNSMDVDVRLPIVLTFNESLNASTINSNNFLLFVNGEILNPTVIRSEDNRTVTLNHSFNSSLPVASVVSVIVTSDVEDISGNNLSDFISVFTTAARAEGDFRPSVTTFYPGNGSNAVGSNTGLVLYINKQLEPFSVDGGFYVSQNGIPVSGTVDLTGNGYVLEYTPDQPWTSDSVIQVYVDSTVRALTGAALNSYQASFRTELDSSLVAPSLISSSPVSGAQDIVVNSVIDMAFSEALDPVSVNNNTIALKKQGNGDDLPIDISLLKGNRVIRITPVDALESDGVGNLYYDYYVRNEGVKDIDGNAVTFSRRFYTGVSTLGDFIKPNLQAITPENGAAAIGVNARIDMLFDEAMNPISFLPENVEDEVTRSLSFSGNNQVIQLNQHSPFLANSEINFDVPVVEDLAGNKVNAVSTSFTTAEEPDFQAPRVLRQFPNIYDVVPVNTPLVIEYDEAIDRLSVNDSTIYITNSANVKVSGSLTLSDDGKTITFNPDQAWEVNSTYYVNCYAVKDMSGNVANSTYSACNRFNTSYVLDNISPQINAINIFNDQINLPRNARLIVKFNELINQHSSSGVKLLKSASAEVDIQKSWNGNDLTIKVVNPLEINADYSLVIEGIEDISGNVLSLPRTVVFSTGSDIDTNGGSVSSISPYSNSKNVALDTEIIVQLSERPEFMAEGVKLYDRTASSNVDVLKTLSEDGKTITLKPVALLEEGHLYSVTTSLVDFAGNSFTTLYNVFTTVDNTVPGVSLTSLADGQTNIPTNPVIQILFDEVIQRNELSGVVLYQPDGTERPVLKQTTTGVFPGSTLLTLTPTSLLLANSSYNLNISGVKDNAGNTMVNTIERNFTTGGTSDTIYINIIDSDIVNGETGVPLDKVFKIQLSEPINPLSLTSGSVRLIASNVKELPASRSLSADGMTIILSPESEMEPGQHSLHISGLRDFAGNGSVSINVQFTTIY